MAIGFKTFYITLFDKHRDFLESKLTKKEFFVLKRFLEDDQNANRIAKLFDTTHDHMMAVIRHCLLKLLCVYTVREKSAELKELLSDVVSKRQSELFMSYIKAELDYTKAVNRLGIKRVSLEVAVYRIVKDVVESFSFRERTDPFWKLFFDVIRKKPKFLKGSVLLKNVRSRYGNEKKSGKR